MKKKLTNNLIDFCLILFIVIPTGLVYNKLFSISFFGINLFFSEVYLFILILFLLITHRKVYIGTEIIHKFILFFLFYVLFFTLLNLFFYSPSSVLNDSRFLLTLIFLVVIPKSYFEREDKIRILDIIVFSSCGLLAVLLFSNIHLGIPWYYITSRNNIYFLLSFIILTYRIFNSKVNRGYNYFYLLIMVFSIIIIESRLVYILAIVSFVVILFRRISFSKFFKFLVLLLFFTFIIGYLVSYFRLEDVFLRFFDRLSSILRINETASYKIRISDNQNLLNQINIGLIFGYGPGTKILQYTNNELAYYIDNSYFTFIYKYGLFGLSFLILILSSKIRLLKNNFFNSEFYFVRTLLSINLIILSLFSVILYHNFFIFIYMIIFLQKEYT